LSRYFESILPGTRATDPRARDLTNHQYDSD